MLCINVYVLSLHVENLCVGYASIYNCIGERPVFCVDLTIVSGAEPNSVDLTPLGGAHII